MEVLATNQDRAYAPHITCNANNELLRVRNLSVNFQSDSQPESKILRQVSFMIADREIVGLLGESGCGKTTTALAIVQLLSPAARVVDGSINFRGADLLTAEPRRLQQIRGSEISIIHQDSDVLNPVMRVGDQVMEILRAHRNLTYAQMRDEVYATLAVMSFENCDRIYRSYAHQLSGGERRRIAIAQALVCRPRLVIADEPTAWLDFKTAGEILALFACLKDSYGTSFLLITHDPDTLAIADRIVVMYAGQVVESGSRNEVLAQPKHPYTQALLRCAAHAADNIGDKTRRVACIPGCAPDHTDMPLGCFFSSRCTERMEACDLRHPELINLAETYSVRCFKYGDGA
jgi:oligopeptide/dipeptide ABC transporter ATP-binding protein